MLAVSESLLFQIFLDSTTTNCVPQEMLLIRMLQSIPDRDRDPAAPVECHERCGWQGHCQGGGYHNNIPERKTDFNSTNCVPLEMPLIRMLQRIPDRDHDPAEPVQCHERCGWQGRCQGGGRNARNLAQRSSHCKVLPASWTPAQTHSVYIHSLCWLAVCESAKFTADILQKGNI